jgi:serine/threonine protein kinase
MTSIPESVPWKRTGRTLGSGGQSSVYEVETTVPSRFPAGKYAMKELKNVRSNQAKQRFLREIEAVKKIDDPRIVKVIDHHNKEDDTFLYYVMPYDEDFIALEKLIFSSDSDFHANAKSCLAFTAECAEALHKVHEHESRIVHRDLKPANILYNTKTQKPLIIDFGCCQIEGDHTITLVDEGVGTPNYMAPECEAGAAGDVTSKSDIYSLGKILWSMVTGYKTFARENPAFTNKNLKNVFPDNPDSWHLTRIFQKTIRESPNHRYENAQKLADDCRRVIYLIDHFPPLERVMNFCPACGQGELIPKERRESPVPMHMIFGNPMPEGCVGLHCPVCGYLSAWDTRVLKKCEQELKTME